MNDLSATDAQQCLDLTTRFFWHLDHNRYEDLMALMTDTAIWYRQGLKLRPGDDMLKVLSRRSPTRTVVHLLSNLAASALEPGRARVTGYLIAYAHDCGEQLERPVPLEPANSISTVNVELAATPQGWRLHRSRTMPLFRRHT